MAPQSSESDPKLVLQKLQHCLGLGGSSAVQDVIFYSLNLKASRGKKRKEYVDWIEEIGLYSLDTRDFNRAACGWHIVHVSKIMKRYMDNLECPYPGRYPDYIYGSRHWFQHVQGEIEAMLLQQFYQEETREQASVYPPQTLSQRHLTLRSIMDSFAKLSSWVTEYKMTLRYLKTWESSFIKYIQLYGL